jgi:hypothetical protein
VVLTGPYAFAGRERVAKLSTEPERWVDTGKAVLIHEVGE